MQRVRVFETIAYCDTVHTYPSDAMSLSVQYGADPCNLKNKYNIILVGDNSSTQRSTLTRVSERVSSSCSF